MARPLRLEFPGAVYHITSRGNEKKNIFVDDYDRKRFLAVLASVVEKFNWLCHAYCLMDNHYHVVIETVEGNMSRGMRQLNGVYTQFFNKKHNRVGHLFQGRYKAILVEKDSYLLALCRYIVLNPVRAGFIKIPNEWQWSSYGDTSEETNQHSFLTIDWILSQFGINMLEAKAKYKKFVLEGVKDDFSLGILKGQIFLGKDGFAGAFKKLLESTESLEEVPKIQRYAARLPLEEIFKKENLRNKRLKDKAIYEAYAYNGYKLKEIADYIGVHYTSISRAIKRVEAEKHNET
ncbi:MAG: transposase [Firmicutes bacterium]|nr:transposase [Bacillota bacterium]